MPNWSAEPADLPAWLAARVFGRDRLRLKSMLLNAISEKLPFSVEHRFIARKEGRPIWLQITGQPVLDENENLIAYRGVVRDVDAEVQAKRDSDRAKSVLEGWQRQERLSFFTSRMAHEVANMLQPALTFCALSRDAWRAGDTSEAEEYLSRIEQTIERSSELLREGRAYSIVDPESLTELSIREIIKDVQTFSPEGSLEFARLICPKELLDEQVRATRPGMVQVFLNLISNALESSPDKPKITITFKECENPEMLEFIMSDQGTGFDAGGINRAFDPFYSTKSNKGEMGLGLPISKAIIERWGGEIKLTNLPACGAAVSIKLPRVSK